MDVYPSALNHAIFQQVWVVLKDLLPKKKIKRDSNATRSPYSLFFISFMSIFLKYGLQRTITRNKKQEKEFQNKLKT